jgi:hypothetical protein
VDALRYAACQVITSDSLQSPQFKRLLVPDIVRVPVIKQLNVFCMPQMVAFRPLQIFNLGHEVWPDPNTFFHVVRS